ncbi:HAMP domain-containing histidine kinase [Sphingomonas yunnanensis]|uniref:sensor histidine kinase n=1 Tax=Sphingomonas yunnanensis TaxID=310400 RepID=UPI001CA6BCF3|nr:HAMP domain-containing sensor histidine kinase [Sphingomonas yunnanensis]MBY9064199.1 HAMP domain-containing histidine kinase [Sphingomonas yunnanensis]
MASDRVTAAARVLVVAAAGAAAASSIGRGLYATASVAMLVAVWTGVTAVIAAQASAPPPPPPPPAPDAAERQRLVAYLDLSPAPLVAYRAGALHAVNRAARRLFASDDMIAAPPPSLVEAITRTPPGRTATVMIDDAPYALAVGALTLAGDVAQVGALIDIGAELKAAEAAALRELVQILSHEIVNALTPIASLAETAAEMLDDVQPDHAAVREAVTTVARRAAGLQRFGDAYRSLARLPAPERRRLATADFIADVTRLFAARWPTLPLHVEAAHAPVQLLADIDQLSAALWAILQNAVEAADDAAALRVTLNVETLADTITFTVDNTGPPIPSAQAEAIFHPFMTTKPAGSGVGLALARQILRGHGGDVVLASSTPGHTRFVATLPRVGSEG